MIPNKPTRAELRRRKRIRLAIAAIIGLLLGQLCHFLPANHQQLCQIAARVLGLVFGGG